MKIKHVPNITFRQADTTITVEKEATNGPYRSLEKPINTFVKIYDYIS